MFKNRFLLLTLVGVATFAFTLPSFAQQTQTMRFDASKTVFVHELGAAVGTSDDDDTIRFLFVGPADMRQGDAASVDVKTDDVVMMAASKRVRSIDDFREVYESTVVGETFKLGIQRGEERFLRSFTRTESQQLGTRVQAGSGGIRVFRSGGPDDGEETEVLPGLGIILQESEGAVSVAMTLPVPNMPETPFAEGDAIVSFGDAEVESLAQLMEVFKGFEIGSKIAVTVKRGEKKLDLEIVNNPPPKGLMIRKPHESVPG
jgi:S1-C subfamily serine protease